MLKKSTVVLLLLGVILTLGGSFAQETKEDSQDGKESSNEPLFGKTWKVLHDGSDYEIVVDKYPSFVTHDGQRYVVDFVSDQNGHQPANTNIPKENLKKRHILVRSVSNIPLKESGNEPLFGKTWTVLHDGSDYEIVVDSYPSYIAPDGTTHVVDFVSDQNGHQPANIYIPNKNIKKRHIFVRNVPNTAL